MPVKTKRRKKAVREHRLIVFELKSSQDIATVIITSSPEFYLYRSAAIRVAQQSRPKPIKWRKDKAEPTTMVSDRYNGTEFYIIKHKVF